MTTATAEKVSPTGVLVTDAEPQTKPWFAARRQGITGTDLPKILGDSKYGNALSVWLDKRGEQVDEDVSEAGEWGNILEDPVAQEWARRHKKQVRRVGVIRHTELPWVRASLDRLVAGCETDGVCGLEVKTRSAFKAGDYREEIPDDVLAQVAWGRYTSGLPHMHVAVLIGGQQLVDFTYEPDTTLEDYLVEQAEKLWADIEAGHPPTVNADSDGILLNLLNRMYADRVGTKILKPEQTTTWVVQYREGLRIEKDGKALKEEAKSALVQLLDECDTAVVEDREIYTYKPPAATPAMNVANLKLLREEDPAIYEALQRRGFITVTAGSPRFSLKREL
jgi:putative phage-type endonuclease